MLGTTKAKTPKEYIESLPEPRRSEMKQLHKLITKTAPKLKPKLWGGTIGYGSFHYRYASGREGDWFVVGLMNRKDGISFYSCLTDGKQFIAQKYRKELPKASFGQSCIRFKSLADVDTRVFARMIKENEAAAKKMKG
jgi:hypothetical protein